MEIAQQRPEDKFMLDSGRSFTVPNVPEAPVNVTLSVQLIRT